MEILSKQDLIDWLNQINAFTEKGSLTSRASLLINKDKELKESLRELADTESDNPSEILYRILTEDFKDTCEVCGKKTQFQDFTRGYKKSCSKECSSLLTVSKGKVTKERIYGDSSYNNLEKHKQTCLERYGKEDYTNHSKAEETKLAKYGDPNYCNPLKNKQTCLERYGVESVTYLQSMKDKSKATSILKYGVDHPMKSKVVKENFKSSMMKYYGVEFPSQNREIHKKILSSQKMTSPEKKINEFLSNNGFEYKYQYECNGKCFDFAIFKDNELSILVEIDGEYFHGLLSDCDGKLVRGDKDCERFSKCPEGVKLIVCDSFKVEDCFSEILRVFDIDYEKWIQEIVDSLPKEFPYYEYSEERMRKDYEKLCTYRDIKKNSRLGDSIINNFHRSIYDAHISTKPSPKEAWNNRELLEKCVRNRFIYSSNLSSHSILQGFNVCKIAPKVSVFSAPLARRLIQTYLDKYNQIFDPFSGFSGRMLGACSLDKSYIGQDINVSHIKESNQIAEFLGLKNVSLKVQNILEDTKKEYECLFTCPPYGGKEHWNIKNDLIEKTCDEWIDECLNRFKCKTYLFVVDETEKYKDYIVEEISNSSHFGNNKEYVIKIDPHFEGLIFNLSQSNLLSSIVYI